MTSPAPSSDRLSTRILWGMGIGLAVGGALRGISAAQPDLANRLRWLAEQILDPVGQIFLRMLFFVVVPLVFASLALGVVQLGRLDKLGPLAGRTFLLFAVNMAIGVALGLLMMNLLKPGAGLPAETRAQLLEQYRGTVQDIQTKAAGQEFISLNSLVEMFMPRNLLKAVLAPYAVAAMLGSVAIKFGLNFLRPLGWFVVGVLGVMLVHLFGTMSLLLKVFTRRSPLAFFRAIRTILVTAFSTSSSNATLPTSLQVSRADMARTVLNVAADVVTAYIVHEPMNKPAKA